MTRYHSNAAFIRDEMARRGWNEEKACAETGLLPPYLAECVYYGDCDISAEKYEMLRRVFGDGAASKETGAVFVKHGNRHYPVAPREMKS